jgi:hypothetical protein
MNMERTGKKVTPMKNAIKKKSAKKTLTSKKKLAKRNAAPKKAETKTRAGGKKTISRETAASLMQEVREKGRRSGELSGDLQGLSNIEDADSESVAELLEEGSAFEADVVEGVEDAPYADKGPVRTHEVPEDDVPDDEIPDEYKRKE